MKIRHFFISVALLTFLFFPLNAANIIQDSGTVRMTWAEFVSSEKSLGSLKINKAYVNRDSGDEWNKYKIKFFITNTEQNKKSLKFVISIFDSKEQLIFSESDEKSLGKFETVEASCSTKVSNRIKFEPETVFLRIWWEVEKD